MARVTAEKAAETKRHLVEAARQVLTERGYAGLSTRQVAEVAGTQMSQIQYHFGSKQGLVLAVFEDMNAELLTRQRVTFDDPDTSLAKQWDVACDFLEDDLESGYVRILQELIAAGWSDPVIRENVVNGLRGWHELLLDLSGKIASRQGDDATLGKHQIAALISSVYLGAEAQILLGFDESERPIRSAFRQIGTLIQMLETA
ncbi:MAG: TetR family transcriptional regulator [Boseongicola sp.]|nr:MAG: TetR family transcriptional regulator [Boseongicola sp.]